QYKSGVARDLRKIGRELGVANVLEGTVQRSGNRVRVNAQLVDTRSYSQLWAQSYDRDLADVFAIQSEIANAIADQLQANLTDQEKQVITAKPTDNPEAYDAYLRGLAYSLKPGTSAANSLGAQKYFTEAVKLDPKFALAWALLSYTDAVGYLLTTLQPTIALREEARQAAETALTLQPNLGEAVVAKGAYHYFCLKITTPQCVTLSKHASFSRIAAGFLNCWLMSPEGKASGTRARSTSTRPSGSTRAMLTYSSSTRFPTSTFVVSPRRCESSIRFSILHRTMWMCSLRRRVLHKPRAIFPGPLESSLRSTRLPTTRTHWKPKLTKGSWSAALHQSSVGSTKYWPSLIQRWVISPANCAFG